MAEDAAKEDRSEQFATLRNDFMRRWFAIAVSVGFATTVVQMEWVKQGHAPSYPEWEHLGRLGAALLATVLSWEGYFISISTKKLYDFPRYLIDILLVFLYLFLLLTSRFPYYWLALHAITFGVYAVWDFLTAWWYRRWYAPEGTPLWRVYWNGATATRNVDTGSVITVVWAAYFVAIWLMSRYTFAYDTFVFAAFVVAGLTGYRYNKGLFRKNLYFTYFTPLAAAGLLGITVFIIQNIV